MIFVIEFVQKFHSLEVVGEPAGKQQGLQDEPEDDDDDWCDSKFYVCGFKVSFETFDLNLFSANFALHVCAQSNRPQPGNLLDTLNSYSLKPPKKRVPLLDQIGGEPLSAQSNHRLEKTTDPEIEKQSQSQPAGGATAGSAVNAPPPLPKKKSSMFACCGGKKRK